MEISKTTFLIISGLIIYIVFNSVLYFLQKIIVRKISKFIWFLPGVILGFIISFFGLYFLAEYGKLGCGLHRVLFYIGICMIGFFMPIFILTKKMIDGKDRKIIPMVWWAISTIIIIFLLFTLGAARISSVNKLR